MSGSGNSWHTGPGATPPIPTPRTPATGSTPLAGNTPVTGNTPPTGTTPAAAACRPAEVTRASVLLLLIPAISVASVLTAVIAVIAAGSDADRLADQLTDQGITDARNLIDGMLTSMWLQLAVNTLIKLVQAVGFGVLAVFVLRGSHGARIAVYVIAGLSIIGSICYTALTGLRDLMRNRLERLANDFDQVRLYESDVLPAWYNPINDTLLAVSIVMILTAVWLLTRPAVSAYFHTAKPTRQPPPPSRINPAHTGPMPAAPTAPAPMPPPGTPPAVPSGTAPTSPPGTPPTSTPLPGTTPAAAPGTTATPARWSTLAGLIPGQPGWQRRWGALVIDWLQRRWGLILITLLATVLAANSIFVSWLFVFHVVAPIDTFQRSYPITYFGFWGVGYGLSVFLLILLVAAALVLPRRVGTVVAFVALAATVPVTFALLMIGWVVGDARIEAAEYALRLGETPGASWARFFVRSQGLTLAGQAVALLALVAVQVPRPDLGPRIQAAVSAVCMVAGVALPPATAYAEINGALQVSRYWWWSAGLGGGGLALLVGAVVLLGLALAVLAVRQMPLPGMLITLVVGVLVALGPTFLGVEERVEVDVAPALPMDVQEGPARWILEFGATLLCIAVVRRWWHDRKQAAPTTPVPPSTSVSPHTLVQPATPVSPAARGVPG